MANKLRIKNHEHIAHRVSADFTSNAEIRYAAVCMLDSEFATLSAALFDFFI